MSDDQVKNWIDNQVKSNDVVLFMKGTKDFPQCGFSGRVAQILSYLGLTYKDINVLEDMSVREGVKAYANWPTIPQLYVKGEFLGGADIVTEMFQSGELEQHLREKGVEFSKAMA
jgi:monothiol glutaredoxin